VIVKPPDTNTLQIHENKLNQLVLYPPKTLILGLDDYTGDVIDITPLPNRNGNADYVVWINGVTYENIYDSNNPYTIDLSTTGIDDTNKIGGIVDGITLVAADARDFLIWAFANNQNNGFEGFAVTHKPYSAYTGPATATVGTTVTFTGLTNAYQFTEGARVAVRNTVGTAPQYQWNWGTITAINSNTSIDVLMDNTGVYSVTLTAATGGEILQWDKFRPWVVSASDQTLYKNNYRLIGELTTDASGNISTSHRVDDPWRPYPFGQIYANTTATLNGTLATISAGRRIPLWSKKIDVLLIIRNSTTNIIYEVRCLTSNGRSGIQSSSLNGWTNRHNATMSVDAYATVDAWIGNTTTNLEFSIFIDGYYVPGGMRE
jgi:hypothetical protein